MSLKDLLDKQDNEKKDNKSNGSFKINFGGGKSSAPQTAAAGKGDGDNPLAALFSGNSGKESMDKNSNKSEVVGPPAASDEVKKKSPSPSLSDLNHESQPENFNDKTVQQFKAGIQLLKDHIDDKDLITDAIRNVLGMLKAHDFLKGHLLPEDMGLMVRGLRNGYGTVIQKKQTKQRKRSASNEEVDKILDNLGDIDLTGI